MRTLIINRKITHVKNIKRLSTSATASTATTANTFRSLTYIYLRKDNTMPKTRRSTRQQTKEKKASLDISASEDVVNVANKEENEKVATRSASINKLR